MRPASAQKFPKSNKDLRTKTFSRYKLQHSKNSHQLEKSREGWQSELTNFQKPITAKIKTVGIIHAYRPDLLKECMLSQKSLMKKFNKDGECAINDTFIKSALTLFRNWRQKINDRLTLLIETVTNSEEVLEPPLQEKVRQSAEELRHYSSKISKQIDELCLKGQNFKLQRLKEKYTLLMETVEHVLRLVDCMSLLSSQVDAYLQTRKDSGVKNGQVEAGVRAIAEKYERQAADSLNFCACHPDNQLLLRLQFKARKMLLSSTHKVGAIFDSIRQLQQYQANFRKQMIFLENFDDFSHQYLGHVLEILYSKNQQLKLLQKKFQVAKMPQFVELRARIEDWQTNFIKNLRTKAVNYLRSTLKSLNQIRTLHLIKGKGKEYLQLKKCLILLVKIYQQSEKQSNLKAEYYQFEKKSVNEVISCLNDAVNSLSSFIQSIPVQITSLENSKDKKSYSGLKLIQKQLEIIQQIQETQKSIWVTTNTLYMKLSRIEKVNPEIIEESSFPDSKCLSKFHQLIFYSRNQQQANEIFKHIQNDPVKKEGVDEMLGSYDKLYDLHQKFIKNGLQIGLERFWQLKQILRQQIIYYLFEDEFKNEFISGYPAVKQLCAMEDKLLDVAGKEYINGNSFYRYSTSLVQELRKAVNEEIKKLQQSKYKGTFNKYIIIIYESMVLKLLNIKQIYRLFTAQENHLQPYRLIFLEYVQVYEGCLIKSKREETPFGHITAKLYEICSQLTEENRIICQYSNSIKTNHYFPSISFLIEWVQLQFSAEVQGTISKSSVTTKREEAKIMFGQFVKKMEALKERLRINYLKTEDKEIYQNIAVNIEKLKRFDFTEDYQTLLIKMMEYLQALKIPHSVIFTKNESPVYILMTIATKEEINDILLALLGIEHRKQNHSFIVPFQYKQNNIVMPEQPVGKAGKQLKQDEGKAKQVVADEMKEEIQVQQGIQSMVIQSLVQEIQSSLPMVSIIKSPQIKENPSQPIKIESSAKSINYFKMQHINDINQLKSCLFYHKNEYFSIQAKLKVALLCQALKPKGKLTSFKHIKDILDEVHANDIIRLMNISDSVPDCQYQLTRFQESLKREDNIRQDLLRLFEYFKIQRTVVFAERNNYIQSFRKQNEKECILHAHLVENSFHKNLRQFKINDIVESIWKGVFGGPAVFTSAEQSIKSSIDKSNTLLASHYQDVQRRLTPFQQFYVNRADIEKYVKEFLQGIFNKRRLIDPKVIKFRDLIESVGMLEKNLKDISVIQPFFTFRLDQRVLFIDSVPINRQTIIKCLLLPSIPQTFKQCIVAEKDGSLSTTLTAVANSILKYVQPNEIKPEIIQSYLQSFDKAAILAFEALKKSEEARIQQFQLYSQTFDSGLDQKLTKIQATLAQEKKLISFLLGSDPNRVRKVQKICFSGEIHMIQAKDQPNMLTYFDCAFLGNLNRHLLNAKIPFHQLEYKGKIIALQPEFDLLNIAFCLGVNKRSINQLQSKLSSQGSNHILKALSVTFCKLIPSFQRFATQVQSKIKTFLANSILQFTIGSKALTKGCDIISSNNNKVDVEVDWPKQSIIVSFLNPRSTFSVTVQQNYYSYFADVQILSLRSHIEAEYSTIQKDHLAEIKRAEEEAFKLELKKQQQKNQLQRLQHERELQQLRAEEEKARLRFGTEQLNRKMKERAAAQQAKLKFIEQTTLAKLKQAYQGQQKRQQQMLSDKINKLSDDNLMGIVDEQFLEFEVSLSEGQDERFQEGRHCQAYDTQYDYRLTLYQYIRQTYHSLRNQKVEVQKWIHRPKQV